MSTKKDMSLQDFHYLVDLIRDRVELTEEEKDLWNQSLKKIESQIEKPINSSAIVPKTYLKKKGFFRRLFNF